MPTLWIEPHPVEIPADLAQSVGGHPLVAEMLVRRGITTPQAASAFLDPAQYVPSDPLDLPDLNTAADRVMLAIRNGEKIGVWGDFDVDGQTSTTLLIAVLRGLGAQAIHHIPVRQRESHGVHLETLHPFLDEGVQLLLTCDTGITANEAVEAARQRGVDTIITDHHTLPPELPNALAVVNPQRLPEDHPLRTLPGVGTAYQLAVELCRRAGKPELAAAQLDLVAMGTVADLALLTGDARYLVQRGLQTLRGNQRAGLAALLDLAGVQSLNLNEEHIGFVIGPRMNALGRLSDSNPIVEFLTTTDPSVARSLAVQLEGLNGRRKLLCDQVFQAAQAQISRNPALLENNVLVLSHAQWPAGVIGIVASRLVDLYYRPVLMISAPPGEAARGSARSVEGINITAAIAASQDLLLGFGGHPMAAGFSLPAERIPDFQRGLNRAVETAHIERKKVIDAYLPLDQVSLDLVEQLDRLSPFGPGNPPLTLAARDLTLRSYSTLGRGREHLQLVVEDRQGRTFKLLWWQGAGSPIPEGLFDLAYTVHASSFRGQREVQIEWGGARLHETTLQYLRARAALQVEDYRQEEDPPAALEQILAEEPGVVVWAEGESRPKAASLMRGQLRPAPALVVWSIPPGRAELQAALNTVRPQRVYWFGTAAANDQPRDFLLRLAGLLQHVLKNESGQVTLTDLAAAAAQREATARKGLEYWAARGGPCILSEQAGLLQLAAKGTPTPEKQPRIEAELKALLQETAAYRAYYLRCEPDLLAETEWIKEKLK